MRGNETEKRKEREREIDMQKPKVHVHWFIRGLIGHIVGSCFYSECCYYQLIYYLIASLLQSYFVKASMNVFNSLSRKRRCWSDPSTCCLLRWRWCCHSSILIRFWASSICQHLICGCFAWFIVAYVIRGRSWRRVNTNASVLYALNNWKHAEFTEGRGRLLGSRLKTVYETCPNDEALCDQSMNAHRLRK